MKTHPVIIRSATVSDAAALIDFLREFQREGHVGVFRPTRALPTLDDERSWIQSLLDHKTSHLWVGCVGERIVGMLDFHGHRHPQMAHGGALGTSVLRGYRGQKVGFELMQALIEWAMANEALQRIELEVFSSNTHAIQFYERLGFVREGAKERAVEVAGALHDIVLMARRVDGA